MKDLQGNTYAQYQNRWFKWTPQEKIYVSTNAPDLVSAVWEEITFEDAPTQPTQEKEEFCQLDDSGLCENHVDKSFASESKPTQDTESWEEIEERLLSIQRRDGFCTIQGTINFIKQKKNEWQEEWDNIPILKDSHMGRSLEKARTQGAEAAVNLLNTKGHHDANGFYVTDEDAEQAKKV